MRRRQAREIALQSLFAIELGKVPPAEMLESLIEGQAVSKETADFATLLVDGVLNNREELDDLITTHARDWKLDRMPYVDRNIMRIAVYELVHLSDIPVSVSINEAVELAKAFGNDDSPKFINGILGQIVKTKTPLKDVD